MSLDIRLHIEVDTGSEKPTDVTLYEANYTHNVRPMWEKAGVYDALYLSNGQTALHILPALEAGLLAMEADPPTYEALNPLNGWGNYIGALDFLRDFTDACQKHPKAVIWSWA